jgi:hypothetical protein
MSALDFGRVETLCRQHPALAEPIGQTLMVSGLTTSTNTSSTGGIHLV